MKDKNSFINVISSISDNFEKEKNFYEGRVKIMEKLSKKKQDYEKEIISNDFENKNELTLKDQICLMNMVEYFISRGKTNYSNVDLRSLEFKMLNVFAKLGDYRAICDEISELEKEKNRILSSSISFDSFGNEANEQCCDKHYLVKIDGELKCVRCNASTEDYELKEDEINFLALCAEHQGILIKEFTKDDEKLLEVLIKRQDYYKSIREELDPDSKNYLEKAEEQDLEDERDIPELRKKIRTAHLLDLQNQNQDENSINTKYLSDEKTKELLTNIELEQKNIKGKDSRFKDLMLEECMVAKYEVLILSGYHIPTLLSKTKNEKEKIALTKAYYNISDSNFRKNSEYFNNEISAFFYECVTANPEINDLILKLRKN